MNEEININLLLDRLYTTGKVDKKYIWALDKDYPYTLEEIESLLLKGDNK